jgi:hypothetical protein
MKILLDILDNKAASLMDVLKSIPYVKAKRITDEKSRLIQEIKEAVENLRLVHSNSWQRRLVFCGPW